KRSEGQKGDQDISCHANHSKRTTPSAHRITKKCYIETIGLSYAPLAMSSTAKVGEAQVPLH
ncbi:hypothetical protein CH063_06278, partial [Colletotrichum higginsianum]